MLNREMRPVTVVSFSNSTDNYGQKRVVIAGTRTVDMVCKIYAQVESDSPIYNEVEMIGITKATDITDANQIIIDDIKYNILHIIPSSRYTQILMKKVK